MQCVTKLIAYASKQFFLKLFRPLQFMTQLAADFAAKGVLNHMAKCPVATGLAH